MGTALKCPNCSAPLPTPNGEDRVNFGSAFLACTLGVWHCVEP
jgi:hypothetical protein